MDKEVDEPTIRTLISFLSLLVCFSSGLTLIAAGEQSSWLCDDRSAAGELGEQHRDGELYAEQSRSPDSDLPRQAQLRGRHAVRGDGAEARASPVQSVRGGQLLPQVPAAGRQTARRRFDGLRLPLASAGSSAAAGRWCRGRQVWRNELGEQGRDGGGGGWRKEGPVLGERLVGATPPPCRRN